MNAIYSRPGTVIVLPSYSEGMNRTLMEACATGKPIITTDIPGCREAVDHGENGYLVPPRQAQPLADAMLRYLHLTPPQRKAFSLASRRKAEEVFDVKRVISVYERLVAGK